MCIISDAGITNRMIKSTSMLVDIFDNLINNTRLFFLFFSGILRRRLVPPYYHSARRRSLLCCALFSSLFPSLFSLPIFFPPSHISFSVSPASSTYLLLLHLIRTFRSKAAIVPCFTYIPPWEFYPDSPLSLFFFLRFLRFFFSLHT